MAAPKSSVSLEDRVAIEELMARYAWSLNTGDIEGHLACFAENGWVEHPPQGRHAGRAALRTLVESLWYSQPGEYLGRQHRMSQIIMTPGGAGVRVRCYWSILRQDVDTAQCSVARMGTWDAMVTRTSSDGWVFESIRVDIWRGRNVPWVGDPRAWRDPPP